MKYLDICIYGWMGVWSIAVLDSLVFTCISGITFPVGSLLIPLLLILCRCLRINKKSVMLETFILTFA